LMDFIKKNQENDAIVWWFRGIMGHQGPLLRHDKDYNGSRFNVLVEWECSVRRAKDRRERVN
jgi:hypothetical protein